MSPKLPETPTGENPIVPAAWGQAAPLYITSEKKGLTIFITSIFTVIRRYQQAPRISTTENAVLMMIQMSSQGDQFKTYCTSSATR